MLKQEYLEIVRLTELLLLQQLPTRPLALPKTLAAPVESEISTKSLDKPTLIVKEEPAPKEKTPIEKVQPKEKIQVEKIISIDISTCNLDPILDMLKTHCPKLKLVDAPVELTKTVIILFDQEPENEKTLLENITAALKKAGHLAHLLQASDLQQAHLQNPANVLIGSRATFSNQQHIKIHARRDASGKLFIAENGALAIPSLSDLIEQPSKRRDVWNEILALL